MRVLYINHTGVAGGAEQSLFGLLDTLPPRVDPLLASPRGPLHEHAARRGIPATSIAEVAGSLRLHLLHTPLALGAMATASAGVVHAAHRWQADVLHANSIRAGMIAAPAAQILRRPLILHVRDCLPPCLLTRRLQRSLAKRARAVIAISGHVGRAFDPDGAAPRLDVIDDPFDLTRLDPARFDREAARTRLALPPDAKVLALVGQITPWKGQEDAIRAMAIVRRVHPTAVLLIVGETKFVRRATRYDNLAYLNRLHELVARLSLGESVRFLGERDDVPAVMGACDMSLAPSWEEPFGRVVVEAMAMGVPVVATSVGGPAETIRDGIDGLLVPPRQPEALADVIVGLLNDAQRRNAIGALARCTALGRFAHGLHAAAVTTIYRDVLGATDTVVAATDTVVA